MAFIGIVFAAKKMHSHVVDAVNNTTEKNIKKAQKALENTKVEFVDRPIGDKWNNTNENYHTVTAQIDLTNDENKLNLHELMIYAQLLHERCIEEEKANSDKLKSGWEVKHMSASHIVWEYIVHEKFKWLYAGGATADLNCEESLKTLIGRFIK